MKIFVATKQTQGQRPSDFCNVEEGEQLVYVAVCPADVNNPDPDAGCGCTRSLAGIICHQATTTFKVVDVKMSSAQFVNNWLGCLQDAGIRHPDKKLWCGLRHDALVLLRAADGFQINDVVELRRGKFGKRRIK